jgi:hypothetical protein
MRQKLAIIPIGLTLLLHACGKTNSKAQSENIAGKVYINEIYRFSATIPDAWTLYGQIKNDRLNHKAIVAWGLPKIYSELEKTEIENSISITAYHKKEINSVDKLILSEYLRINPIETALEIDKSNPNARMIYTTLPSGLKYQGKSYYVFKNELGYVITFMATPGTYDKNIKMFEEFYSNVKFLQP